MAWRYNSATGVMSFPDGAFAGAGYAGHGAGVNNPALEAVPDTGPIPHGEYDIGPAFTHPQCGPVAMRLTPRPGTDTHGRSGFLIHGDTAAQNHTASHGCIIEGHALRLIIDVSEDKILQVSAEPATA